MVSFISLHRYNTIYPYPKINKKVYYLGNFR